MEEEVYKERLPNATGTLVLGILSLATCWTYGILGIVLGVIALVISGKAVKLNRENPDRYQDYGNVKTGRITAIIGLVLSVLVLVYFITITIISGEASVQEVLQN